MPKGQSISHRSLQPEDYAERDWMPRCCIKLTTIHKFWLRCLLRELLRRRVNAGQDIIEIEVNEIDFLTIEEILAHIDNYRFIKSSIEPLTQYGSFDNPDYRPCRSANPRTKKNLQ